ncbi:WbqC family protein [Methanolobus sp. ZRKC3]|uniref:WbqC family protein n=1 Tax=Methanolobus sp. ZRKC3 TaxID=3125786 RepID=UPI003255C1BB
MIVAIHQPNHLPYLGFFDKMLNSDIFVIHDDAQFTDSEYIHRNKIRIHGGWKWITVPVFKEKMPINEIKIKNQTDKNAAAWNKVHFREIHANYKKTPYYDTYSDELEKIYSKEYNLLIDLNMKIIEYLVEVFDIDVEIRYSSELKLESCSTEKLVEIVKAFGGDAYLAGAGGHNYMDESLFTDIKLVFQEYKHPSYKQRYPDFIPNMAAIDALFNLGGLPS